jgi:hypothetical protein
MNYFSDGFLEIATIKCSEHSVEREPPKFVRLGKDGSVFKLDPLPDEDLAYWIDQGMWGFVAEWDEGMNLVASDFLVDECGSVYKDNFIQGTSLIEASENEYKGEI